MEGFGIEKLVLVLVIALVMFGAKRLPEIGASFGKGIREFKRGMNDLEAGHDAPAEPVRSAPAEVGEGEAQGVQPEPKRLLMTGSDVSE